MKAADSIVSTLQEGRRQFLALVEDVRSDLHRYCARMTGSVVDGEDVVQDALARAYYELSQLRELPALRAWLFRIAHNRALDYLRAKRLWQSEPLDSALDVEADDTPDPEHALERGQAVHAAVSRFLDLAPAQRSCVILKDVLDYSLEETAALLELSVPAVKAALHRGRTRLKELSEKPTPAAAPRPASAALARYAALFNARDWDGVRAMLVEDVKLDLVSRTKRAGREAVGDYFTNYDKLHDWHLVPAWLESREILAVFRDRGDVQPGYFVELTFVDGGVAAIRDFRYVPYIAREAIFAFREKEAGMKTVLVRYKIKPDRVAENESYIARVFEQLAREQPAGLRYASFELDDGQSFVHLASLEGAGDANPLTALSAFKEFVARIRERCEEGPVTAELKEVGRYRFFGE